MTTAVQCHQLKYQILPHQKRLNLGPKLPTTCQLPTITGIPRMPITHFWLKTLDMHFLNMHMRKILRLVWNIINQWFISKGHRRYIIMQLLLLYSNNNK